MVTRRMRSVTHNLIMLEGRSSSCGRRDHKAAAVKMASTRLPDINVYGESWRDVKKKRNDKAR